MYFMLPVYMANMAPVIFRNRLKFLDKPMDFGKTYKGKRILGANKTIRGLIVGIILAIIIVYLQYLLKDTRVFYSMTLPALDYSNWFALGILMGAGAIIGDAVESFFKRRLGIVPGKPWVPFDQVDFVVGALLFVSIIYIPKWYVIVSVLLISFLLHFLTNHTAYWFKIRKEKW